MKELELTSNAALTDVVYEAALNGSLLNVKLVTGAVGDDEIRGLIPEANHYHVTHPKTSEEILFEQPLDASDNKVPVYGLGALIQSPAGGCHGTLAKGESRTATARKVVVTAHWQKEKAAQPQHVKWLLTDQCGYMLP